MTQTIEEKARELLAKHYESSGTHHYAEQLRNDHQRQPQAIAALTEALTRIEELEGMLETANDEIDLFAQDLGLNSGR